MATAEQILGEASLARFRDAGAVKCGLPPAAYTDAGFFALENARLFQRHWVFAGFAHEFERAGDVRPVSVGGRPVLLVRDREGEIKAFHNVCRHRSAILVEAAGNVGPVITCPYHAWAYGLDGALRAAPHFGGPEADAPAGFEASAHGLVPIPCARWHDWVFVKLAGAADDFEDFVAPLARHLEGVDWQRLTPIATIDFGEVPTNWKFLIENFIEPYHVQFVHKTTTDQPLTDHYIIVEEGCLGCAIEVRTPTKAAGFTRLDVSSLYLTLFPNFVLARYEDQLGVHLNLPVDPGRTSQRRVIYWTGETLPSAPETENLRALWTKVHHEDHAIVARLQQGRASPAAGDGGLLSPYWEDSVRHFQERVLAALEAPGPEDE